MLKLFAILIPIFSPLYSFADDAPPTPFALHCGSTTVDKIDNALSNQISYVYNTVRFSQDSLGGAFFAEQDGDVPFAGGTIHVRGVVSFSAENGKVKGPAQVSFQAFDPSTGVTSEFEGGLIHDFTSALNGVRISKGEMLRNGKMVTHVLTFGCNSY